MIETPKYPSLYQLNKGKQTDKSNCIRPDCDCLDYCEAEDPHSVTPKRTKQQILKIFKSACSKASYHFADDTGKEWGAAQKYVNDAKEIASQHPEYMGDYELILKDQLVSYRDIFGI